jgi:hypothetical protein
MATIAERYEQLLAHGYSPDHASAAFAANLCLEHDDDAELGAALRELVTAEIESARRIIGSVRRQIATELAAKPGDSTAATP